VDESIGYAAIGVGLSDVAVVKYPWYRAIYEGGKASVLLTGRIVKAFYFIIHDAILGKEVGVDFAGPVGIAVMTGQAARMGWSYILQFTALLSINLAIINILPLPALDGGRLLFIAIEKVRRRPVSKKVENIIHSIGFLILIGLMLFITGRDIFRFDTLVNKFF
jgi:regulator of sigma E protease